MDKDYAMKSKNQFRARLDIYFLSCGHCGDVKRLILIIMFFSTKFKFPDMEIQVTKTFSKSLLQNLEYSPLVNSFTFHFFWKLLKRHVEISIDFVLFFFRTKKKS